MGNDAFHWYRVSAQGGHAGPSSTVPYINCLELALADASRHACPRAWLTRDTDEHDFHIFPGIGDKLLTERPPLPARMVMAAAPSLSKEVHLMQRKEVLAGVANGLRLDAVASKCNLDSELVEKVLEETVEVLVQLAFVRKEFLLSRRSHVSAVTAFKLFARAAEQQKFETIAKCLDDQCNKAQWKSLRQVWSDWTYCQNAKYLSVVNTRPALRLIQGLLSTGVEKRQLLILSAKGSVPLAKEVKALKLQTRDCKWRAQRADHRLFLVPRGVDPTNATAATVSMVGFHWLMVTLGSILVATGEI